MMNELLACVYTWLSAGKESTCNAGYPCSIPGSGRSPGEGLPLQYSWPFLVTQMVKNPPAVWEPWVLCLGWDPLEEGMATHFLPGESPRTEEPIGLQAMGSQRVRHDWVTKMYVCIPDSAHTSLHLTLSISLWIGNHSQPHLQRSELNQRADTYVICLLFCS